MFRETAEAVQPARLPTIEVAVRIDRGRSALALDDALVHVPIVPSRAICPCRVRWKVVDDLMADEMILVFGRSLDWTGPRARHARDLPLIENVFPQPVSLTRRRPQFDGEVGRIVFPEHVDEVGCNVGAVLVRGDDRPWVCSSILRFVRRAR